MAKDAGLSPRAGRPRAKVGRGNNPPTPTPRIKLNVASPYEQPVLKPRRELTVAERRQQAWDLRLEGHPVTYIADVLQLTANRVYELLREYSADIEKHTEHTQAEWRNIELARLDALLVSHWKDRDITKNATVILNVLERKHKLLGLETTNKNIKVDTGPVGVTLNNLDLSRLTDEELGWLEVIIAKALPQEAPLQALPGEFVALPAPENVHG